MAAGGTLAVVSAAPQVAAAAKLGVAAKVALASLVAGTVVASPPVRHEAAAVHHHGSGPVAAGPRHAVAVAVAPRVTAPVEAGGTGISPCRNNGVGDGAGGGKPANRGQGHAYGKTKHGATASGRGHAYGKSKHGARTPKCGGHAYGKTKHAARPAKAHGHAYGKAKHAAKPAKPVLLKKPRKAPKMHGSGVSKGHHKAHHGNGKPHGNGGLT